MQTFTPSEDMLHQYILQKLSAEDDERVELWLIDHPEIIGDLKLDLAFAHAAKPMPKFANNPKATSSFFDWFLKPQFALTILVSLTIGYFIAFLAEKASHDNTIYQPITFFERLPIETQRGINSEGYNAQIFTNKNPTIIILELNVNEPEKEYAAYKIISHINGKKFLLNPTNKNNIIPIALHTISLSEGHIELELFGVTKENKTEKINHYKIQIIQHDK